MKITALDIVGFGVWSHRTIAPLSGGLNVFYGPNEAGKTTLMQFIRGLLYGFTEERRAYIPPVSSGPAGGRLEILTPNGSCVVERFLPWESTTVSTRHVTAKYAASTQSSIHLSDIQRTRFFRNAQGDGNSVRIRFGVERFVLHSPDGREQGESEFRVLLNRVDERIFRRVFCVGLDELRELETLHESEVAALLYQISVGTDRVSLFEVLRKLRDRRRELLDPESGLGEIADLVDRRATLHAEIAEACEPSHRFPELLAGRERIDREIAALEADLVQSRDEDRRYEAALSVRDRWKKRVGMDQRIGNFPKLEELPFDAPDHLVRYDSAIEERRKVLADLDQQREKLKKEAAQYRLHAPLQRNAAKIEALAEQEPWVVSLAAQLRELRAEIHELETLLEEDRKRFGLDPKMFNTLRRTALASLQRPAEQLAQSRLTLDQFDAEHQTSHQDTAELRKELEDSLRSLGATELDDAVEQVGDMVAVLRHRVQLEENIQQSEDQVSQLATKAASCQERQMLPLQTLAFLGVTFVTGALLILLYGLTMIYQSSPVGVFGTPAGLVGLGLVIGSVFGKQSLEKTHRGEAERYQTQVARLEQECAKLRQERDQLDRELPTSDTPWAEQLAAAEEELAELEKLIPLDTQIREQENAQQAAARQRNSAEMELDAAKQRWFNAVQSAGLPESMTPREVKELLDCCEHLDEMRLRLERSRSEYTERTREQQMLHSRIGALVTQIDPKLEKEEPVEIVRILAAQLHEQAGEREKRQQAIQQLRRIRKLRTRHDSAVVRLRRKRRLFLDQLGVRDDEELQLRIADQIELGNLQKQRTLVQREIAAALSGRFREEEIQPLLATAELADQLDEKHDRIAKKIRDTETRRKERLESRGRLQVQIQSLAQNVGASSQLAETERVERRLRLAVRRWKTLAIAHGALERVRQNYERTRQPEALREASGYLARFTNGRYVRIWTPLQDDVLFIDDQHGRSFLVEQLSRGTREQLFLCLRLALASSYAKRGIAMPLVFDDVFVNFDTRRSESAIEVLEEFAKSGHQIFVFTCHEHIADIFERHGVEIHRIGIEDYEESLEPVAEEIPEELSTEPIPEPMPEPIVEPEPVVEPEPESVSEVVDAPVEEPPGVIEEVIAEGVELEESESDLESESDASSRRRRKRRRKRRRPEPESPESMPSPAASPTGIDHLPPWEPESTSRLRQVWVPGMPR